MLLGQSRVFFSMSKDGLLPSLFSTVHPRFRTPWISTLLVGTCAAFLSASLPIDKLGDMVNIGTLLAFVIVCAGVWIVRRRNPNLQRPFRTPWVPFVPIMGMLISAWLMWNLPWETWVRLVVWLFIGLCIYFGYGRHHSRVQQGYM
jgi:APA family basic amino acid/polyamine antiporter